MRIKMIVIGKVKDKILRRKSEELQKWLSRYAKLEVVELKECSTAAANLKLLTAARREKGYLFVMDEKGKEFSSEEFAAQLQKINQKVIFIIGGPDGLSKAVKEEADQLLALSKMTFTHEMARLFLTEQLYRACSIINGGSYHRS